MDVSNIVKAQEQFRNNYDVRVKELTNAFQTCLNDLRKDYEAQMGELETA